MSTSNIIKLAASVKPPAKKSEIIEALSIRKREQIIAENAVLAKELKQLETKLQVVCAEEIAKSGKLKRNKYSPGSEYQCRARGENGRVIVSDVECDYACDATEEIRKIARRIYEIKRKNINHDPSLHEVRQQVRAALALQTPPDQRVNHMVNDPESQKMLDALLETLDRKPKQLTLTA